LSKKAKYFIIWVFANKLEEFYKKDIEQRISYTPGGNGIHVENILKQVIEFQSKILQLGGYSDYYFKRAH
jgi:hypothetical protein